MKKERYESLNLSRTIHSFPNIHSVKRQTCENNFFIPNLTDIIAEQKLLKEYFQSNTVGLVLPLASKREDKTFPKTLEYAQKLGIAAERTIVIHTPQAQALVSSLRLKEKKYIVLDEEELLKLFNTDKIFSLFAVDISRNKGKGRAFVMVFAYLKYLSSWKTLKNLFFVDVDTNIDCYQPLHYLGYPQIAFPDDNRLSLLTAQNNALRDNHYLFVMRDYWRQESDLGRHYAAHLDKLIWYITGEFMLRWDEVNESIPFSVSYGVETVWQLYFADQVASSMRNTPRRVAQVVNPQTKRDGGSFGQSGRCYDAIMYRQLNLMAWLLIKYNKHLNQLTAKDYQIINTHLSDAGPTVILPDNEDHGLPYIVDSQADLFIPPLKLLAAEGCLHI